MIWPRKNSSSVVSSRTTPRRTISSRPRECAYAPVGNSGSLVCSRNGSQSMPSVLMMMVAAHSLERVEDFADGFEMNVLALQQLAHGGIGGRAHGVLLDGDGEMQVADHPADARGVRGAVRDDFVKILRLLRDGINARLGFEKSCAVLDGMLEIKSKVGAIHGACAPPAPGEHGALHAQFNARFAGVQDCDFAVDQFH